ncbi:amino acid adenylation domain-containing protein [Microcoleus sp. FACHB-SPT15]|nr:amino acid adenylation domain-containing protein [Microcoleus sp. FACHB-SPT15]
MQGEGLGERLIEQYWHESEVQRIATEEAQQPFDLTREPLWRVKLLRLGEQEHVLLLTLHHIIGDEWSVEVFIREMAVLYKAFLAGSLLPLPELPVQYTDFAYWQRQWLQGELRETQLAYWKQQLNGVPSVLQLPTDHPRPAVQTYRGASQSLELPKSLADAIQVLSRQEGVTPFMVLLAAFQTLLYRYTGQDDISVGSPIANRNRRELSSLIGFFVNTLVLRTDLGGNPSFRELLSRVRQIALGAYAHQDLPFDQLVEALRPVRDASYTPLFQVSFALREAPQLEEVPGLALSLLNVETFTAQFDLSLFVDITEQGLIASFEYNTDLFEAATITRMLGHFQNLLLGIVSNPDQRLSDLPLLSEAERHQLLVAWNDTQAEYPTDLCIHQLFEAQVERTPNAIAVVFENQQLTYQELNNRANQLAHYLKQLGVKPEVLVGLCVERSLEMVIGLLAIQKAGGAYVPLDPSYPKERLSFMLSDSQASVLLTQQKLEAVFPEHQAHVIYLDKDCWELTLTQSEENPVSEVKLENLAYVIYTSGSTGRPKGVMISHRAICNHMFWMQMSFPLSETDKVLQKTPFSFDASIWEFYAPLLVGAQLIVARPGGHQDSVYLTKVIAEQKVTTLQLVPSLLRMLLEEGRLETCNSLRRVFCGGEALPVELQECFFASLDASLHNLYGPTEACIDSTFWTCKRKGEQQTVPIGRPIANTQIYILDPHLQLVPIGVPGELHIGGDSLARGYLNLPGLTDEKFIPNPFSDEPKARLYKTGDLARYRPDGSIEILGRIDHQVKLRGFRIELGEIEAVLVKHPAVREVVALVREDQPGEKQLVAYVVSNQARTPTTSELRNYLKGQLPEYMLPSVFVLLDTLPLLPNGKVARRSLPATDGLRPTLAAAYEAPRSETERAIASVWRTVLNVEKVGVNDNFFDLGGHSLLILQVNRKLRKVLNRDLSVVELFQNPTINSLAQYLSQKPEGQPSFEQTQNRIQKQIEALNRRKQFLFKPKNLQ